MDERIVRWGPVTVLALFTLLGAALSGQGPVVVLIAALVSIAASFTMWPAGRHVLVPALVIAVGTAVICSGRASNVGWFALCVVAGWCTVQAGPVIGSLLGVAATVLLVQQWILISTEPGWATWIVGTLFTIVSCTLARRQRELVVELRRAQAGLLDQARAEERLRISRELHDVVAHSLTVSLLHVSSARLAVQDAPDEAAAALAEAERLGRQSLTEVRQAVGLMREGDATPVTPLPGVEQIPALIEGFRRAGVQVACPPVPVADLTGVTATVGLTAYRVLQEALTNAARHAPGARTAVHIEATASGLELVVGSEAPPAPGHREGIGLTSMRERVQGVGGEVEAGRYGDGWRVRAVLPREADPVPRGAQMAASRGERP